MAVAPLSAPASRPEPAPGWQKGYAFTGDSVRLCWHEHHDPRVPPGRPALLCLAGLTRNGADFAPLAESLGADWRLIAPTAVTSTT